MHNSGKWKMEFWGSQNHITMDTPYIHNTQPSTGIRILSTLSTLLLGESLFFFIPILKVVQGNVSGGPKKLVLIGQVDGVEVSHETAAKLQNKKNRNTNSKGNILNINPTRIIPHYD